MWGYRDQEFRVKDLGEFDVLSIYLSIYRSIHIYIYIYVCGFCSIRVAVRV